MKAILKSKSKNLLEIVNLDQIEIPIQDHVDVKIQGGIFRIVSKHTLEVMCNKHMIDKYDTLCTIDDLTVLAIKIKEYNFIGSAQCPIDPIEL